MRTNIDIDDKLLNDALKATGLSTKKDVDSCSHARQVWLSLARFCWLCF